VSEHLELETQHLLLESHSMMLDPVHLGVSSMLLLEQILSWLEPRHQWLEYWLQQLEIGPLELVSLLVELFLMFNPNPRSVSNPSILGCRSILINEIGLLNGKCCN